MVDKVIKVLSFFLISISINAQSITWDGGGDGVNWEDKDNWNTNVAPSTTSDVNISFGQVELSSSTQIRSLNINGSSATSLTLNKNEEIIIGNALGDAVTIEDDARFYVEGIVQVVDATSLGVELDNGLIEIKDEAVFQVEDSGNSCVNIGASGIFRLVNNTDSPQFNLSGCQLTAISNQGLLENNGGELSTSNLDLLGIYNTGNITNNGGLQLSSFSLKGIDNFGPIAVLTNSGSGQINISGGEVGLQNSGSIVNSGNIDINSSSENCIESISGTLVSHGTMELDNAGENGMLLSNTVFTNSGNVFIGSPADDGIYTSSKVENFGLIQVSGVFERGIVNFDNSDSLKNSGIIRVINPNINGIYNQNLSSVFYQSVVGELEIEDATVFVRNSGNIHSLGDISLMSNSGSGTGVLDQVANTVFKNEGNITIDDLSSGIGNAFPGSVFENTLGASITLNRVSTGIVSGATFLNNGDININECQFYHISHAGVGYFENQSNGIITLDSLVGATALGVFQNIGTVINRGQIDITDKSNTSLYFLNGTLQNFGDITFDGGPFNTLQNLQNFTGGKITGTTLSILGGVLENNGELLDFTSIYADDLLNAGLIYIPIGKIINTPIHNYPNGVIRFDDTEIGSATNRKGALIMEDKLINEGLIEINQAPEFGIQFTDSDSLLNSGSIVIKNTGTTGIDQAGANGVIHNLTGGIINLSNTGSYGIDTEADILSDGSITIVNSGIGLRTPSFTSAKVVLDGDTEINGSTNQGIFGFGEVEVKSNGYLLIESCGLGIQTDEFLNSGDFEVIDCNDGIWTLAFTNSGSFSALNILNNAINRSAVVSGTTFSNTLLGIMSFENVGDGINFVGSLSSNYGEISIDGATRGINSAMDNYGKITASNATTGLTGGITNKVGGEIFLHNNGANSISLNEACGYIKSTTGYEIGTNNYGFISHPDSINANIRVSNYGVFENVKGLRQGQAGSGSQQYNNDGLITGKINGKPSLLVNELNAMRSHPSWTVSNANLYTDPSLTTLAGSFNASDDAISLNTTGITADTLYTSVNYGPGCTTIVRIPVRQNSNCGGVYSTATPSGFIISTNFQWHDPRSWVDKIVPDGCTKVLMDAPLWIPANSKARAHSIDVNVNFRTGIGAVLEIDPSN